MNGAAFELEAAWLDGDPTRVVDLLFARRTGPELVTLLRDTADVLALHDEDFDAYLAARADVDPLLKARLLALVELADARTGPV